MDATGVSLSVDRGDFPRASAGAAEGPSPRTAVGFRERSGAVRTGTAPICDLIQGECVGEHLFDAMVARSQSVLLDYDRPVDQEAAKPDSLSIYLPNPESELSRVVIKGSAIVGQAQADGRILIHYEGNRFDLPELRMYRQRADRAATRLLYNYPHGYPTRARDVVESRDVEPIGTLELPKRRLHISRPAVELSWWLEERDLVDLGLIAPATG